MLTDPRGLEETDDMLVVHLLHDVNLAPKCQLKAFSWMNKLEVLELRILEL